VAPPSGQIRPGRYLAFFLFIVVLLYGLVFGTPDHKLTPKLGIDLQGGTRVTLTARTETGAEPSREALNQARQIIERRVNGLGVGGTEVILDGDNLVITVAGDEGEQAKSLGQTAQLRFRSVLTAVDAAPTQPPASETPAPGGTTTAPPPTTAPEGDSAGEGQPQGRPAPAAQPTEPTPPPSGTTTAPPSSEPENDGSIDPKVAAEITKAKQIRQVALQVPEGGQPDQAAMQLALDSLNCAPNATDPLVGNDDPKLPLATCDQDGTAKYILGPAFLEGTQIANASSQVDPQGAGYIVSLDFKSEGSKIWADFTSANVGKQAAFTLDTKVVSAPNIESAITGGPTQISGGEGNPFSADESKQLAEVLKYGSLPLSFQSSEAETVSATLGLASLKAGLIAGAIGLALVFVYCLFYYRMLGVLTMLSLTLSAVIVFAVLVLLGRWIGFTLDLAGVAGFIVAIGITADSFVIFFERLKDEIREGRTFRSAVPRAWIRARRTILSADAVMFLAAAVLYLLAVGQVRGFAFTLGMSTVLDLVVVFFVTHPLVALASRSKLLSSPRFSGLGAVQREARSRRTSVASGGTVAKEA